MSWLLFGSAFFLLVLLVAVEAPVEHDEMDVPKLEIVVTAGDLFGAVARVHPVVAEDLPNRPLPGGTVDCRSVGAVVDAEIMVVPGRI